MQVFGQNLAAKKAEAIARINELCGRVRACYITDLPGQQAVYAEKQAAARNFLENGISSALLDAEVGITGDTVRDVAAAIMEKADEWRAVISKVENCRLFHVSCVRGSGSVAAVNDAVADFDKHLSRLADELP